MKTTKIQLLFALFLQTPYLVSAGNIDNIFINSFETKKLWSDPNTWPNGSVPMAGDDVVIPAGLSVLLDISPPALGKIEINGELCFENQATDFTAHSIMVSGMLQVGNETQPITEPITITLTGTDPDTSGAATRGIMVMNGVLKLHGQSPQPTWTKLATNTDDNAGSITVIDDLESWLPGDDLVIAPTDFFRIGRTEMTSISTIDNSQIDLQTNIQKARWGSLQYINSTGVTLTPDSSVTEKVIDQRAEIGNISRNIVIQSIDDALWQEEGFGVHIMIMRPGKAFVNGVQIYRGGQAGIMARYPIHWHLWSYNGNGQETGDAAGQYFKNSAVVSSSQRCVIIHGTNGVSIEDNICYDIRGHAMFLEDAVERRNVFDGNLILHVNKPLEGKRLLAHESKPSGFWLTNPDNIIRNNVVADSDFFGFWLAYPRETLGLNKNVDLIPHRMEFGVFDDNTAHSNKDDGLFFDKPQVNDAGGTQTLFYTPLDTNGEMSRFTMNRFVAYKHEASRRESTIWTRMIGGTLMDFIVSDYTGVAYVGSSRSCGISHSLAIGFTQNIDYPTIYDIEPMGAASYHSRCKINDNVFVNLIGESDKHSGAFSTTDYYTEGVDKGLILNSNNTLINSHPGYRSPSKNTLPVGVPPQGNTHGRENYAYSGALWDPYGYWGPAEN